MILANYVQDPNDRPLEITEPGKAFIWDLSTGNRWDLVLPATRQYWFRNFCRYTRLAYTIAEKKFQDPKLITVDNTGQVLSNIALPDETWSYVIGWYDPQSVLLSSIAIKDVAQHAGAVVILDPNTGEEIKTYSIKDYPDALPFPQDYWAELSICLGAYNFQKELVVYALYSGSIALWDMQKSEALTEVNATFYSGTPRWSPDGSVFAFDLNSFLDEKPYTNVTVEQIFLVDTAGNDEPGHLF